MNEQYLVIGRKRTKAVISAPSPRAARDGFRRRIKGERTHIALSLSDLTEAIEQMGVVQKTGGMWRMA